MEREGLRFLDDCCPDNYVYAFCRLSTGGIECFRLLKVLPLLPVEFLAVTPRLDMDCFIPVAPKAIAIAAPTPSSLDKRVFRN